MSTRRLLLRGGLVADGIGDVVVRADVLVNGATIEAVGLGLGEVDAEVIELAEGSVVCPGFIDAHVHAEGPLLADGVVPGALAQGVTTLVVGQDGSSWIGANPDTVAYLNRYFGPVNGTFPRPGPCRLSDYTELVAGRLDQNVAVLASQGTIRHNIVGAVDRPLTPDELAAARADLEQELAAGAVGLSSGLDYVPSRHSSPDELAALASPLAGTGRPYVSHLRTYGPKLIDGLAELAHVGATAGVPVHASHLWGEPADLDVALTDAEARGIAMTFDMYPYIRSSTILAMLVLPPALQAGGQDATLRRLTDPALRADLLASPAFSDDALANVYLALLPDRLAHHAGSTIAQAAATDGKPPGLWTLDLLVDTRLQIGANLNRPAFTEDQLRAIVTHPRHSAGSDGIYQGQHPHPRAYGAFARLAGYYTNPAGQIDHQQLVRHLATNAADTYGLHGRGRIGVGRAADLAILNQAGIVDSADYADPRDLADGIAFVVVNGTIVRQKGRPTDNGHPGAVIGY